MNRMETTLLPIDPYASLKADLYAVAPDALIAERTNDGLPYRFILWGTALTYKEAIRRIERHRQTDRNYRVWRNPTTSGVATVSVIETDDEDAATTIGRGLLGLCYRVLTPDEGQQEADIWRSSHSYRLVCRSRVPVEAEFAYLLDGDELIVRNVGYEPGVPRWPLSAHAEGVVHAILVNDPTTAHMLKITIGNCDLEEAGAA